MTELLLKDIINDFPYIFNSLIKNDINIDILERCNSISKKFIIFKIDDLFYKYDRNFLINYWKNLNKEVQFREFGNKEKNYLFNFPQEKIFIGAKDINLILKNNNIKFFALKLEKEQLNLSFKFLKDKINFPNSKLYKIDKQKMKESFLRISDIKKIKKNYPSKKR